MGFQWALGVWVFSSFNFCNSFSGRILEIFYMVPPVPNCTVLPFSATSCHFIARHATFWAILPEETANKTNEDEFHELFLCFAWRGSVPPSPDFPRWWDGAPPPQYEKLQTSSSYSFSFATFAFSFLPARRFSAASTLSVAPRNSARSRGRFGRAIFPSRRPSREK